MKRIALNNNNGIRTETPAVGDILSKETLSMKCGIQGCPGEYEEKRVLHTVRHRGQVIATAHVPAEVCSVCGDVLLKAETYAGLKSCYKKRPPSENGPSL